MANPGAAVGSGALITPGGAQGPTGSVGGSGPTGPAGPAGGASANTSLTAAFVMPAVNATAVASVSNAGAFSVGGVVYISPLGYLNVQGVNTGANQLTLQNIGTTGNQAPGSSAPSGNAVTGVGPQGPVGPQGQTGLSGSQGPVGASGAVGPVGPAGPQGAQGSQGPQGDPGAAGAQGPVGLTGSPGPQGIQGPQGVAGQTGQTGPTGATGPPGVTSLNSAMSVTGTGVSATPFQLVGDAASPGNSTWYGVGPQGNKTWFNRVPLIVNVKDCGAAVNGTTDDTSAVQTAINNASAAGGGRVVIPGPCKCTGTFTVPSNVTIAGAAVGPYMVTSATTQPTFLITNTTSPFLTLGWNSGVEDLAFYYPNQVAPTATPPTVYPWTISIPQQPHGSASGGVFIRRCTTVNAYQFIDAEVAHVTVEDCYIGALATGIQVDHALDYVFINKVVFNCLWDWYTSATWPSALDTWVQANGYAIKIYRADAIKISNIGIYNTYCGILFNDSSDTSLSPRCANGTLSNIDIDTVVYGIIAYSIESTEQVVISNLTMGSSLSARQYCIALPTGGTSAPILTVTGGSVRGFPTPFSVLAGQLFVSNIRGYANYKTATVTNVALVNATLTNIASFTLDPGNWLVWGTITIYPSAALSVILGAINSATTEPATTSGMPQQFLSATLVGNQILYTGQGLITIAAGAAAPIYLLAQANFSGTCKVDGFLAARRFDT